ncbi:HEPN domain-containing protein [Acidipropionibacterium acidipropionici]|uniref:ApeA N-terminal domain 1-containing protein n=1 Tax=Acidipropionibacterium acidipropionici TaxID=1748 RepID=UPI000563BA71|nr:HEPN domain-containing protein [Acidipropionibacterium acidipropionici]ALN14360.1 hypothetical protein ASQ49_02715 [Acidipropionibacterium acidipropionici]APZ09878.1 hypothetical protein BWX38_12235 [Acidipropionibacterium acidipropionici]
MAKDIWLDESVEWRGHWWLPGDADNSVPGILRYEPEDGLHLELIGGFEDRNLRQFDGGFDVLEGHKNWPMILGTCRNTKITLLGCFPIHSSRSFFSYETNGPDEQTISVTTALTGVHLTTRDDRIFSKCLISVENLGQWSGSHVFSSTFGTTDGQLNGNSSITLKRTESPTAKVDGATVTLRHESVLASFDDVRAHSTASMRDAVCVSVAPEAPMTVAEAQDWASAIQDLVSLGTDQACAVLRLELRIPLDMEMLPDGYPVHDHSAFVYNRGIVRGHGSAPAVEPRDMLFTCDDIPFDDVLPLWWTVRAKFSASIGMLLGLKYSPAQYVESKLLSVAGAAESFHRALGIAEKHMPDEDFKTFRKSLLEITPKDYQAWIKDAVRNSKASLRARLRGIAHRLDSDAMAILIPDVEEWARKSTRARNALAHTGEAPDYTTEELHAVVTVTSAVVTMNLLIELGLPGDKQRELANENPGLQYASDLATQFLTAA